MSQELPVALGGFKSENGAEGRMRRRGALRRVTSRDFQICGMQNQGWVFLGSFKHKNGTEILIMTWRGGALRRVAPRRRQTHLDSNFRVRDEETLVSLGCSGSKNGAKTVTRRRGALRRLAPRRRKTQCFGSNFCVWDQVSCVHVLGGFGVAGLFKERERRKNSDAAPPGTSPRRAAHLQTSIFLLKEDFWASAARPTLRFKLLVLRVRSENGTEVPTRRWHCHIVHFAASRRTASKRNINIQNVGVQDQSLMRRCRALRRVTPRGFKTQHLHSKHYWPASGSPACSRSENGDEALTWRCCALRRVAPRDLGKKNIFTYNIGEQHQGSASLGCQRGENGAEILGMTWAGNGGAVLPRLISPAPRRVR
ncbi:hypothetical protein C8F04DRAFT_1184079 [Mycena alexandri]|uniref:Uncharacterized protein n=1 Tax=Mycena alexandri TaxID=1745969 RepID=A0AAD6X3D3_9AGAR|nr:hypothetical protein C8F04DRAFT_1184079 [Mycena alexandri]